MRGRVSWITLLPTAVAVAGPAHATVYMTVEAAQQQMFPSASAFADRSIAFSSEQRKAIARKSGEGAPKKLQAWEVRKGDKRIGWFVVDRVLGKHDYITYAVALDTAGHVRAVEVLEYRETYGGEIRNPRWRQQFVGKGPGSQLKLDQDIRNISGATLSSQHVTQGIKRIVTAFGIFGADR